jgi:hypothetical protein
LDKHKKGYQPEGEEKKEGCSEYLISLKEEEEKVYRSKPWKKVIEAWLSQRFTKRSE